MVEGLFECASPAGDGAAVCCNGYRELHFLPQTRATER
jgi:hypothetical protein